MDDSTDLRQLPAVETQRMIRAYIDAGNYSQAAFVAIQLAERLPNELWPNLRAAESLLMNQQIEPAFRYVNRALIIDPANIASLRIKSRLYLHVGDREQAVQLIDLAISLEPENPHVVFEKGEILTEAGDVDGARKSFLKSIDLDVRHADSLLSLSRLPGDNFSDELIKTIEFIVQSRQLPAEKQIKAHFALATAYDKKSEVDRHFFHLKAGNNLKSRFVKFDPAAYCQKARQTIEFFSREFFAQQQYVTGNPARIFFIVGFPRCGSTLVEQILCTHPDVCGAGEIFALNQAIQNYEQSRNLSPGYPYWVSEQSTGALTAIADDYMRITERFNQKDCMTDKQLPNYHFAGLIHLIFPNAKIINVQRNPIDVCYSCYKRLFTHNSFAYIYNLEHLATAYRAYQQVITHWSKVLPGKIHSVEYEQLINEQEETTRDLLEYCELPWDEACMNFHKNERAVHTHSNTQVRQQLYADSIDRWKVYKDYLGPLMELTNA